MSDKHPAPNASAVRTDLEADIKAMIAFVTQLADINVSYLRKHGAPPLYGSGIAMEPCETLHAVGPLIARQRGCISSLAAYRLAELWTTGERAAHVIYVTKNLKDGHWVSLRIQRADGTIEDIERMLEK